MKPLSEKKYKKEINIKYGPFKESPSNQLQKAEAMKDWAKGYSLGYDKGKEDEIVKNRLAVQEFLKEVTMGDCHCSFCRNVIESANKHFGKELTEEKK